MTADGIDAAVLDDVTVRFGATTALDRVTTSVPQGAITGVLGRNGAGKTTLMQLLVGHHRPTEGDVRVLGATPYENDDVLRRTCLIREGQQYPDWFEVRHALAAAATVYPDWDGDLADELVAEFDLPPQRAIKKLSRGMASSVGIVVGLASRAPVTLFDEPTLGLDAVSRQTFYDRLIADYAEHPRTVVLSTHLIEEVSGLLERVLLLDRGRVLLDEDADHLRDSAVTVAGPTEPVLALARTAELLHAETAGGQTRAVLRADGQSGRAAAAAAGLACETTSLQQLVVAMSRSASATPASPSPAPLEKVL